LLETLQRHGSAELARLGDDRARDFSLIEGISTLRLQHSKGSSKVEVAE